MHPRRAAMSSTLCLAAATLVGREARAHCGDDCTAPLPYSLGPTSDVLAPDSVLVYPVPDGRAAAAQPFFTLTVTDAEGVQVEGSVEVDPEFSLIVWRPAAPWVAGATYTATGRLDTAAWATAEYAAPPGGSAVAKLEPKLDLVAKGRGDLGGLARASARPEPADATVALDRAAQPLADAAAPSPSRSPASAPPTSARSTTRSRWSRPPSPTPRRCSA